MANRYNRKYESDNPIERRRMSYRVSYQNPIFREKKLKYAKAWRDRARLEVLVHYSGINPPRCKWCNIDDIDVLCIDHINGGGNEHRRRLRLGGRPFLQWLRADNYPEGYQVLCWNCNAKKEALLRRGDDITC